MKQKLLKTMLLLCALVVGSSNVWATDVTYKTAKFGSSYNSKGVSGYTGVSFDATYNGFTVNVANFNNNNNGWELIKCGGSKGAYTGTIITDAAIDKAIKKVTLTIDAITVGNVTSMTLYTSTNKSTWSSAGTFDKSTGAKTVELGSPTANLYYKIEIVCTKGSSNGLVTVSQVDYKIDAVAAPTFSLDAGSYSGTQSVELSCATDGASIYYTTDGSTPTTSSTLYSSAISVSETTTIKAIGVKAGLENSTVSSATYTITTDPIISLSTYSIAATTAETDGTITVTYSNLTNYDADIYWYEDDGTTSATYDWIDAEINASTKNVDYTIAANTSTSSRTAYLKVYALGDEGDVYSSLVTITQVGVDYVTLPFSYTSGKSDIATTTGISQSGLGSDYSSSAILKFDNANDYVIVKTNAPISSLYYDIKGNSFSGGTFKVQTSADGVDYSDLKSYTSFTGDVEIERFTSINSTVRYIKWIYTTRSSGNVGMGNIHINCEPVTVTTANYATYATSAPLDFTGKAIKAYIAITKGDGTGVTFTQINKVPANTGILLYKDGGSTEVIPVLDGVADATTGNKFVKGTGTTVASTDGTNYNYILNNGASGIGFYKAAGQKVAANRAYISVAEAPAAGIKEFIALPGFEDDADGINEVNGEGFKVNGPVYDLQGRRVEKPSKGLYIMNGKKVLF